MILIRVPLDSINQKKRRKQNPSTLFYIVRLPLIRGVPFYAY